MKTVKTKTRIVHSVEHGPGKFLEPGVHEFEDDHADQLIKRGLAEEVKPEGSKSSFKYPPGSSGSELMTRNRKELLEIAGNMKRTHGKEVKFESNASKEQLIDAILEAADYKTEPPPAT